MIKGGYYIKARCIQDSEIAIAPPHIRETWDWLLNKANHKDKKYAGFLVQRGQLFRTYYEIREGLSWMVGWRKMMYSENQTKRAMKYLRSRGMIDTTKAPRGMIITICNYNTFQDPKNYERTHEDAKESTEPVPTNAPAINKNDKNVKKKNNIYSKEIIEYLNTKANTSFKYNIDKTKNIINARVKEGFSLEDFKKVIDIKVKDWLHDEKFNKYLRPITLFSNKFESYLAEANTKSIKEQPLKIPWKYDKK